MANCVWEKSIGYRETEGLCFSFVLRRESPRCMRCLRMRICIYGVSLLLLLAKHPIGQTRLCKKSCILSSTLSFSALQKKKKYFFSDATARKIHTHKKRIQQPERLTRRSLTVAKGARTAYSDGIARKPVGFWLQGGVRSTCTRAGRLWKCVVVAAPPKKERETKGGGR